MDKMQQIPFTFTTKNSEGPNGTKALVWQTHCEAAQKTVCGSFIFYSRIAKSWSGATRCKRHEDVYCLCWKKNNRRTRGVGKSRFLLQKGPLKTWLVVLNGQNQNERERWQRGYLCLIPFCTHYQLVWKIQSLACGANSSEQKKYISCETGSALLQSASYTLTFSFLTSLDRLISSMDCTATTLCVTKINFFRLFRSAAFSSHADHRKTTFRCTYFNSFHVTSVTRGRSISQFLWPGTVGSFSFIFLSFFSGNWYKIVSSCCIYIHGKDTIE